jgi:hypothetical protein
VSGSAASRIFSDLCRGLVLYLRAWIVWAFLAVWPSAGGEEPATGCSEPSSVMPANMSRESWEPATGMESSAWGCMRLSGTLREQWFSWQPSSG